MAFIKVILLCCLTVAFVNSSVNLSKRLVELERQLLDQIDAEAQSDNDQQLQRDIQEEMQRGLTPNFIDIFGGTSCKEYFDGVQEYNCAGKIPIDFSHCEGDVKVGTVDKSHCLAGFTNPSLTDITVIKGTTTEITPHGGAIALKMFCMKSMMVIDAKVTVSNPGSNDIEKTVIFYTCETHFKLGCADFGGVTATTIKIVFRNSAPSHYARDFFGQGCAP